MRTTTVVLLSALAVALLAPATAQEEFQFSEDSFIRVAVGDVPRTNATEAAGLLNVVEAVKVQHDGNNTVVAYDTDAAGDDLSVGCSCDSVSRSSGTITVGNNVPEGEVIVTLTHAHAVGDANVVAFALQHDGSVMVTFYLASEYGVSSNAAPAGPSIGGSGFEGTITQYATTDAWFAVHGAGMAAYAEPEVVTVEVPVGGGGFDFLSLLVGLVVGVGAWYVLVQQGMVQKRRRQEVSVAAHKEVASKDTKEVLEGRKRLLMAGLKDLEMARMNKEIDDAAYDALKAEFKKQTVTTMRAIEEAS